MPTNDRQARRKAGEEKRANQEAAGIPDSKPFVAPEQTEPNAIDRILECHINGVKIRELNLDVVILQALDYWATDEGIQEKNARPNVRDWAGRASVESDELSKALQERRDDVLERNMELYEARDPLKDVTDRYIKKGMRGKFLSSAKIKDAGGSGDYEIVKDEKGDPVRVRTLVLGQMPASRATARRKFYQERGNRMLKQITETYKKEGESTAVVDDGNR